MEKATNERDKYKTLQNIERFLGFIKMYKDGMNIEFNEKNGLESLYQNGQFVMAYYGAERKIGILRQNNVENVVLENSYSLEDNPGNILLKYLIHLKTQQAYARNEGDMETVAMLDKWFERFVEALRILLDNESIQLKYDYKNYNFEIIEDGRKSFGFDQLSDGYSAVIQIVADLILRMEQNWLKKCILSSYDVEGIVEGYFEIDTYSEILLQKVKRYEELVNKQNPTEDERAERATLLMEMKQLSGDLAREVKNAFEEIEGRRKQNDKV